MSLNITQDSGTLYFINPFDSGMTPVCISTTSFSQLPIMLLKKCNFHLEGVHLGT